MNINKDFLKQSGIFLLFLIGFWAISALYLSPAIGGEKVLQQGDMQQVRLMRLEADQYKESHGQNPGWVDGLFGGMPSNLITGIDNGNLVYTSGLMQMFKLVERPFNFLFVAMLSMFVLLLSANVNRWLAAAGAIGYAFMTFSITSYEAGHITKVLAMGAVPGMLAGLVLLSRGKYLWGAALLGVFFALILGYFHYQIAYYAGIIAGIFIAVEVVRAIMKKETKHALYIAGISIAAMAAGTLSNIGKIIDTQEYAKSTMRGGSEVTSESPKAGPKPQTAKHGLDKDYAFAWSYGIQETYTLFVPRFMGGSSRENIGENELTGEEPLQGLYWGDLQFTSGPVYIGAIFIFLFILSIVAILGLRKLRPGDNSYTAAITILWFSVITTLVSFMLAWGKYFFINDFLFQYLPYYNKFRTPMMAFTIAQVTIPFFGLYGLNLLVSANLEKEEIRAILKKTLYVTGALFGIGILMIFMSDFSGAADPELRKAGYQGDAMAKLKDIRKSQAWIDLMRSIMFVGASLLLIGYTTMQKKGKAILWIGLVVLISFDMIGISRRYLSDDNWEEKDLEEAIGMSPQDAMLVKNNKDYSRVYDLRYNPFNDNHSAPWHRNIGGYHPAKLSRYQDIISYCITKNGGQPTEDNIYKNNALDMLNCKYLMAKDQKTGQEQIYPPRMTALGNAWFVNKVIPVPTPKAAIEAINTFNPSIEAIVEAKSKTKTDIEIPVPIAENYTKDSNAKIEITSYSLDTIKYQSTNSGNGLAVFSEIYYNQKNAAWVATIDGKPAPVIRVNYILRALEIPAGTHKIEMIFSSQSNRYLIVEKASSGLLLALLAFTLAMGLFKSKDSVDQNA